MIPHLRRIENVRPTEKRIRTGVQRIRLPGNPAIQGYRADALAPRLLERVCFFSQQY